TIDGAFVRRADGTVLPNSFQPVGTMPPLQLTQHVAPVDAGAPAEGPAMTYSEAPPASAFEPTPFDSGSLNGVAVDHGASFAGTGADAVVHEYLRSMRQAVAADRDVLLSYLGAAPAAATTATT